MFINAESFFQEFESIRLVFAKGAMGSGKSLLAFAMAHEYVKRRKVVGVWSNVPHTYPHAEDLRNAFIIPDEPGQFFDSRFSGLGFDLYGMWARKMGALYAFPSVVKIDNRARNLQVMRVYNLDAFGALPFVGFTMWFYLWESTYGGKGWFALFNPKKYFGTYVTGAPPINDGGTLAMLIATYPEQVKEMLDARSGKRIENLLNGALGEEDDVEMPRVVRNRDMWRKFKDLERRMDSLEGLVYGEQNSRLASGVGEVAVSGPRGAIEGFQD